MNTGSRQSSGPRWGLLALALLLLDAALTFRNLWPTPAIVWVGDLSIELAAGILILLLARRRNATLPGRLAGFLAALWVVLVVGHYGEVTAPALFGRPINLYWDVRHLGNVAAMIANPAVARPRPRPRRGRPAGAPTVPARWALRQVERCGQRGRARAMGAGRGDRSSCSSPAADHRTALPPLRDAGDRFLRPAGAPAGAASWQRRRARRCRRARHSPRTCRAWAAPMCCCCSWSPTARWPTTAQRSRVAGPRVGAAGGGHPRHRPGGGVRLCRVADLRRRLVAGAHQPAVGSRGARSGHQRCVDDPGCATPSSPHFTAAAIAPWR